MANITVSDVQRRHASSNQRLLVLPAASCLGRAIQRRLHFLEKLIDGGVYTLLMVRADRGSQPIKGSLDPVKVIQLIRLEAIGHLADKFPTVLHGYLLDGGTLYNTGGMSPWNLSLMEPL